MADDVQWLKTYYGKDYDLLNPSIVREGKKWALVKLNRPASRGYSSIGYVLIKKSGSHSASSYQSLHEGLPSKDDLDKMFQKLDQEEKAK